MNAGTHPPQLLIALAAVGSIAVQAPATQAHFDALIGYYSAGSATWQQDNPEAGAGEPSHWVRRHTAAPTGSTAEVVAVYPDGRCEPVTTIRYRWSSEDRRISTEARAANGLFLTGIVESLGDGRFRTTVDGVLPDGTQLKMRDTADLSSPDASVTTAERWTDEGWVPLDTAKWRRVSSSAWCGTTP